MKRILVMLLVLSGAAALAGCATATPKAWERAHLAKPEMAWDPDPTLAAYRSHTYTSKEQASGGGTVGGGGCGCSN